MLDFAPTPTSNLISKRLHREAAVAAAVARRQDHGSVRPGRATELAARPWRDGQLRLMREPWGHYTILHTSAGEVSVIGEADAAMLAELLYARMIRAEPVRGVHTSASAGEA